MIDISTLLTQLDECYASLLLRSPGPVSVHGDFDIVVSPKDHRAYCLDLLARLANEGGFVIQSKSNSYLASFTIALCPQGIDAVAVQVVKIDVFIGLAWNGLGGHNANSDFFACLSDGTVDRTLLRDIATVVQKITYAGNLDSKTKCRLAHEMDKIESGLLRLLPQIRPGEILRKWPLRWRTADKRAIFCPAWIIRLLLLVFWRKLINRDGAKGMVLEVSGMDGSGKSTQIGVLNALWAKIPDLRQVNAHLLPEGYPLPHKIFRRKMTQDLYTKPYSEAGSKRRSVAWAKLGWYLLLFGASALHKHVLTLSGHTVVFDRSFLDFIVDPNRAKISITFDPDWAMAPRNSSAVRIYLDVSPKAAVERKGELTPEQAAYLSERYLTFAERFEFSIIDANRSIGRVHRDILSQIDHFHLKNLWRRL